jgi:hypothetical protein
MLLVVKFIVALICVFSSASISAREIYILVVGQSISSNCNQHVYNASQGLYQIGIDGNEKLAADPFDWADCDQGSMWIPLGERLVQSGFASKVTFMPIGVAGTSVGDWKPGGRAFHKLMSAIKVISKARAKFDYALWHQGSSDVGENPIKYRDQLAGVLKFITLNVPIDKWVIAQHTKCGQAFDSKINKQQKVVGSNFYYRRFLGPDTDSLGDEYRYDGCHLNKKGQEKMAKLWFESILEADRVSDSIQKETLLYYFRKIFH